MSSQLRITRASYESDLARRRFMLQDPANRLVAAGLETEWNARLRELAAAEDDLKRFHAEAEQQLSAEVRERILALCRDLPQLWTNPAVIDRERKEILALLIEDVTLHAGDIEIGAQVRLRGGACHSLTIARSASARRKRATPELVTRIDQLLELGDDASVADRLNAEHAPNWRNGAFTNSQITNIRRGNGLRSHRARRLADCYETVGVLATRYHVTRTTIRLWAKNGLLERSSCGGRHRWYYRVLPGTAIVKGNGGPYPRQPRIVSAPTCHSSEIGAIR